MVIAPSPAIYSWRALCHLRGESSNQAHLCEPVGSFAEADQHRVVASFPRSYVFA